MRIGLLSLLLTAACSGGAGITSIEVEADSPVTQGARLAEAVGIETAGGVFTPILASGCALPCAETATFGTAEDDQSEILLYVFRGNGTETTGATDLGVFEIAGYPIDRSRELEVTVTFRATRQGISLSAVESSAIPFELRRGNP